MAYKTIVKQKTTDKSMKTTITIMTAIVAVILLSCCHANSDYETEQAELEREQLELAEGQAELKEEREELRREYAEMKEEYLREKAEFQKEQKALRKSVKKENPAKSVKRDTTIHQLTDTEISELTDKVKSAGLWPTDK